MEKPASTDIADRDSEKLPKTRSERRREETRRRLMKAAYEIIAKRGLEGLVIQDITEAADVGYGSFYNHFASKDAIVEAVIDASRDYAREMYRRLADHASDRSETFALEILACLRLSKADKTWGWFTVRTVLSGEDRRSEIEGQLQRVLDGCAEAGVYRPELEMAYELTMGLLLIGTLKLLREDVPDDYPARLARTILTHLGTPEALIKSILAKPFPDLELRPFLEPAA